MQKRDSSYTLCKGFVEKLIEKHKNIKNINIEIHDTSDDVIKTSINLDNKIRTFDINIKKKKKIIKPGSMNNLKNQKETQNNKNEEILINENKKDSIINIDDKKSDKSLYGTPCRLDHSSNWPVGKNGIVVDAVL